MAVPIERRKRSRVSLHWTLHLSRAEVEPSVRTRTENVSCDGFYCVSTEPFAPGERLQFELVLPAGQFGYSDAHLRLQGRAEVLRVETKGLEAGFGLGCRIEDYALLVNLKRTPAGPVV
jgi:hypothetical protein